MQIMRLLCVASFGAAALFSAREAAAQDSRDVVIRLYRAGDTTASIRGATVTIDHSLEVGTTDSAGIVRVLDLDDGGHIIEVVVRGYQAFFDNFRVGPGMPQPLQFELLPIAASDTATTKGAKTELTFAAFETRRAKGEGKFFTRAQLEAASGRPLANLLGKDAGALIALGPNGESQLAVQSAAKTPCHSAVIRDGVRVYPFEKAVPPDLDKLFAEQFGGIELYSSAATVPAELREAATCGALVLWSRDAAR